MTDTPDPTPETVQDPASPPPVVAKPRSPILPVLGGAVAAVIGFGVAQVVPAGWPMGNTTALDAAVAAQVAEVAALSDRLDQLAAAPQVAELEARVSAVEAGLTAQEPVDLLPLSIRIDDVERKLAELALRSAGTGTMDQAALTAPTTRP